MTTRFIPFLKLLAHTYYFAPLVERQFRLAVIAQIIGKSRGFIRTGAAICTILLTAAHPCVFAQTTGPQIPAASNVIPPGPTAASLGQYGEIPVGYYTGVPSISVPLGKVMAIGGTEVPIRLNYHASGIRVDNVSGWVGLGWSLDCGGVITRTVHGTADDGPTGYLTKKTGKIIDDYLSNSLSQQALYNIQNNAVDGKLDLEPDVYTYNFSGRTGQFVFDHDGVPTLIPQQGLSIEWRTDTTGFKITDEKGTIYQFLTAEDSKTDYIPNGWRYNPEDFTSSWYLTRVTPVIGSSIKFVYSAPTEITYPTNINENKSVLVDFDQTIPSSLGGGAPLGQVTSFKTYTNLTVYCVSLVKISTTDQSVEFVTSEQTELINKTRLDSIIFRGPGRNLVRKYGLEYTTGNNRNFLLKVREIGLNGVVNPPFEFSYNPGLPPLYGDSQDSWGYFNRSSPQLGRILRTALDIGYRSQGFAPVPRQLVVEGADKSPDVELTKSGVLSKIIYPTGGTTKFEYELNDYSAVGSEDYKLRIFTKPKSVSARANYLPGQDNPLDSATFRIATSQIVSFSVSIVNGGNTRDTNYATCFVQYLNAQSRKTNQTFKTNQGAGTYSVGLNPGTYRIYAYYEPTRAISPGFTSITARYQDSIGVKYNETSGGLRIRRITSSSSLGAEPSVKEYLYVLSNNTNISSGYSVSGLPLYRYNFDVKTHEATGMGINFCLDFMNHYTMLTSNGCGQAGLTQGAAVGYSEVTELNGKNGSNGKTVFKFTSAHDNSDKGNSNYFPFAPSTSYDYKRGLGIGTATFKLENGNFQVLSRTSSTHSLKNPSSSANGFAIKTIVGLKVGKTMDDTADNPARGGGLPTVVCGHSQYIDEFDARKYSYISDWVYPIKTIVRRYASPDTTVFTESTTAYRYDNPRHYQLTGLEQATTEQVLVTRLRYPLDFAINAPVLSEPSAGIASLVEHHVLSTPIERQQWRRNKTDSVLIAAQLVHYKDVLPKRTWTLNVASPIASAIAISAQVNSSGAFIQDSRYREEQIFDAYDSYGNILQQHRALDKPISYLWGYSGTLPIAEIKNATYSSVNTTLQQLGIDITIPMSDAQLLSAMSKLRQQLGPAQVTSFTHKPLIGLNSQTDPSGRTTTYEYDALGRLLRIRDQQGRILSQQQYRYVKP